MTNDTRRYSLLDRICLNIDQSLRTLHQCPITTERENPATHIKSDDLSTHEKKESASLMRVNHTGEVCAQALYQGQALTARTNNVRKQMEQASLEENDHLEWCGDRLKELDSHTSLLNPIFYTGAFTLGVIAGLIGDKWSLGFLAETENQVVKHLESHLQRISHNDHRSRAIIDQMIIDEGEHETGAINAGGATLPGPIKKLMQVASKLMTSTVNYV